MYPSHGMYCLIPTTISLEYICSGTYLNQNINVFLFQFINLYCDTGYDKGTISSNDILYGMVMILSKRFSPANALTDSRDKYKLQQKSYHVMQLV